MFTEKKIKSGLSTALALGMAVTSVSIGAQTMVAEATPETDNSQTLYTTKTGTVTASTLTLRQGPAKTYAAIGYLSYGTKVTVLGTDAATGWYNVQTSAGKVGYVSNKYLTVSGTTSSSGTTSGTTTGTTSGAYVVQSYSTISKVGTVTASSLRVRTGPGTSYSIKTSVYYGNVVGILAQYSNGWYKVQLANGTTGYCSGSYLTIKAGTAANLGSGSSSTGSSTTSSAKIQAVVNMVKAQVGKPYVYGAAGPSSFDCSGLTYYCYRNAAGITLNRSAAAQSSNGRYVSKSSLQPGDLVFFNSGTSTIRHVGMYIGGGQFIHAPSPGKTVRYENLYSSYYVKGYMTARRIIG